MDDTATAKSSGKRRMATGDLTSAVTTRLRSKRDILRRWSSTWSLADDLHLHILSLLRSSDLARMARVSKAWKRLALGNEPWAAACRHVWHDKAHVSSACRDLCNVDARAALRRSLVEARVCSISKTELCNLTFHFRFKRVAGSAWTATDPYWLGKPARTLRFRPDGQIVWSDPNWDGVMRWKLQGGLILRVKHATMGAFPGEKLQRHPTNWAYIFHSPWVVYSSCPMRRDDDDKSLSDRSLARSVEAWQWREAEAYNQDESSDAESDDDYGLPALPEGHMAQDAADGF